ncbi:MAG: hypothetical protein JWP29_330, partial [Rhodoferax sp.]|nr:hypothetical protein [Rhodoferax sp.]
MSGGTPDKAGPDPAPDTTPVIRQATYGRNFSYFSHRIFVTYFPEELHDYLGLLFTLKPEAADSTAVTTQQNDTDEIEIELVRWVLLHRSQLNPLALNRLIEAWRGPNQELRIPVAGGVRSDHECRVDITIQFALELELAAAREHWLLQTRPRLQMALLDAAYFVTRQWMEFNRPEREGQPADFGEPGRDDDHPVLDLSSQDVFRGYLVHRMNLLEDKDQKQGPPAGTGSTDGDKHDVPAEPSPLNEPEFKWLFSIVLGIANTLSTATSKDEVKRRWLQVEKSRRSSLPPATALYDALLTEDNKTVLIESEDGSLRYRWRPPPDRGLASSDPREIAGLTRNARRRIAFVADTLRRAMTSADGTPPAVHPLRTLADRYHVLPTTPAWERVETALSDLRAAQEQGLGNPQALASDDDVVRQYDALLSSERAASVVVHMLVMGAALAGMVPRGTGGPATPRDRPDGAAWELALQAIGDALLLDSSTLAVTERSLLQAYADLGKLLPLPPYPRTAGGTGVWPSRPQLEAALAAAFAAGQQSQHDLASEATLADAGWRALQTRLSAVAQDAAAAPLAQAVEMVCLVRAIGPGASLPQRLDRTGYRFWTKLLIT